MKKIALTCCAVGIISLCAAQQNFYDVAWGDGHGVRLWESDSYKIHMGNSAEYHYGPVTDYSIKTNMSSNAGRGWTWGTDGTTPIAALDNTGKFQIAGLMNSQGLRIPGRYAFGVNQSAIEIEVPGGSFNAIRGVTGSTVQGTIHFFESSWGGGSAGVSAGSINLDAITCVTIGPWNNPAAYFRQSDGFVGIGTTYPDSKLTVKGEVHSQSVKVDLNGAVAPDYVFDQNYKLPHLETIRSYIDKHHHLPEVPSANQMAENGINLGEMNLLLLKKIEELTLYILDQEKRIKQLENK